VAAIPPVPRSTDLTSTEPDPTDRSELHLSSERNQMQCMNHTFVLMVLVLATTVLLTLTGHSAVALAICGGILTTWHVIVRYLFPHPPASRHHGDGLGRRPAWLPHRRLTQQQRKLEQRSDNHRDDS
jgi:hypothetical protein